MSKTTMCMVPLLILVLAIAVFGQDEKINDLYFNKTTLADITFDFPCPDSVLFDHLRQYLNAPGLPFHDRVFAVYRDFIRLKTIRSGVAAVFPDLESLVERSQFSEKALRFAAEFLLSYKENRRAVDAYLKWIQKYPERIGEYATVIDIMRNHLFPREELKKAITDFCERTSGRIDLRLQALNLFFIHRFQASGWKYLQSTVDAYPAQMAAVFNGTIETLKAHAPLSDITNFWIPRLDPYIHTAELVGMFRFLEKAHQLDRFIEDQKGSPHAKAYSVLYLSASGQNGKIEELVQGLAGEKNEKQWAMLLKNLGPEFSRASLSLFLRALNRKLEADTVAHIIDLLAAGNFPGNRVDVSDLKIIYGFDANLSFLNGLFSLLSNSTGVGDSVQAAEERYGELLNLSYIQRLIRLLEEKFTGYAGLDGLRVKLAACYQLHHQYRLSLQVLEKLGGERIEALTLELKAYRNLKQPDQIDRVYRRLLAEDRKNYLSWLSEYATYLRQKKGMVELIALFKGEIGRYPDNKDIYLKFIDALENSKEFVELEQVYRQTAKKFSDSSLFHKLARFYLNKKKKLQFQDLSLQLAETLGQEEIREFLNTFLNSSDANFKNLDYEFLLGIYRKTLSRFPTDAGLARNFLRLLEKEAQRNDSELKKTYLKYFLLDEEINRLMFAFLNRNQLAGDWLQKAGRGDGIFKSAFLPFYYFNRTDFERSLEMMGPLKNTFFANEQIWKTSAALNGSYSSQKAACLDAVIEDFRQLEKISPSQSAYIEDAGNYLAYSGRYGEAEKLWERLVSMEPGNVEAYLKLAFLHKSFFNLDKALEVILRAEKLGGGEDRSRDLLLLKGMLLSEKGDFGRSFATFFDCVESLDANDYMEYRLQDQVLRMARDHENVFENALQDYIRQMKTGRIGLFVFRLYTALGKPNQATRFLLQVIPQMDGIDALERIQENFQDSDEQFAVREATLRRLIALDPLYLNYYSRLAGLYESGGRHGLADGVYHDALDRFANTPKFDLIFREYLDSLWRSKQFETGFALIRRRIGEVSERERPSLLSELADKYIELRLYREAREILAMLARSTPEDQSFQNRYLQVLEAVKDDAGLVQAVGGFAASIRSGTETFASKKQRLFFLYRQAARSLETMGRHEKSVDFLIEAINQDPLNLENLKWSYFTARNVNLGGRIKEYYRKLADTSASNYRWAVVLSRIHQLDGEGEEALKQMQRALEIEPHLEFLYDQLFRIHYLLNRPDRALEILKKQLAISDQKRDVLVKIFTLLSSLNRDREMEDIIANLVKISPNFSTYASILDVLLKQKKYDIAFSYAGQFLDEIRKRSRRDYIEEDLLSMVSISYITSHRLTEIFDRLKSLRTELAVLKESQGDEWTTANLNRIVEFLKSRFPENIRQYAAVSDIQEFRETLKPDLLTLSGFEFSESFLKNLNFIKELTTLKSYYFNYYLNDLNRFDNQVQEYVNFFEGLYFPKGDFGFFSDYMVNYEHFKQRDPKRYYQTAFQALKLSGNRSLYYEYLSRYINLYVLTRKISSDTVAFGAGDEDFLEYLSYLNEKSLADELDRVSRKPFYYRGMMLNFFLSRKLFSYARQAVQFAFDEKSPIWKKSKTFLIDLCEQRPNERLKNEVLRDLSVQDLLAAAPSATDMSDMDRLKLSFIYYRHTHDGRFLYSLAEKSPLSAADYETTADALAEVAGELPRAEEYYRNALHFGFRNPLLGKIARVQFRQGKKTEALKTAEKIVLSSTDDLELYLTTLRDLGKTETGWERVKGYLLNVGNQSRADFLAGLSVVARFFPLDSWQETLVRIASQNDRILDRLLSQEWIERKSALYELADQVIDRFTLKRKIEIWLQMASEYLRQNHPDKAAAALDKVFDAEKNPAEEAYRLRLAIILKKNSPADLNRFIDEAYDKFPDTNFSESLYEAFKSAGKEEAYNRLQVKKYGELLLRQAYGKEQNSQQLILYTLKAGDFEKALALYNDLSAEFGYNRTLLLATIESFLRADGFRNSEFFFNELAQLDNSIDRFTVLYLRAMANIRIGKKDEARGQLVELLASSHEEAINEKGQNLYLKYFPGTADQIEPLRSQHPNLFDLLLRLHARNQNRQAVGRLYDEYVQAGYIHPLSADIVEFLSPGQLNAWPTYPIPVEISLRLFAGYMGESQLDKADAVIAHTELKCPDGASDWEVEDYVGKLKGLALPRPTVEGFLVQYFDLQYRRNRPDPADALVKTMKKFFAAGFHSEEYARKIAGMRLRKEKIAISEDLANAGGGI